MPSCSEAFALLPSAAARTSRMYSRDERNRRVLQSGCIVRHLDVEQTLEHMKASACTSPLAFIVPRECGAEALGRSPTVSVAETGQHVAPRRACAPAVARKMSSRPALVELTSRTTALAWRNASGDPESAQG